MNSSIAALPQHWIRKPLRITTATLLGATAIFAFAACGDDDDDPTPTPTTAAATTPAGSPTSGASPATTPTRPASSPTNAPTTAASPTGTAKPDGTVAPQNPGDTQTKDVKSNPDPITGVAIISDLRLGHHPEEGGWERIVFEFEDGLRPSATIEYVDSVSQCGSGMEVEVEGEAILSITMFDAQAHTPEGEATLDDTEVSTPPGGKTILEGIQVCDFEAQVQWAFGLTGEQNFKVMTLENPARIVVDIKQ